MSNSNANTACVAGLVLNEALDRLTALADANADIDSERMGQILLDALQRRGLKLAHADVHTLDDTTPLPVLLDADTLSLEPLPLAMRVERALGDTTLTLALEKTQEVTGAFFKRQAT